MCTRVELVDGNFPPPESLNRYMDVVSLLEMADGVSCFVAASGIGSHIWRQCYKLGQNGRSMNVLGLFYPDAVVSCADNYSLTIYYYILC